MKKIIQTALRKLGYQLTPLDIFDFYHEADPAGLLYGELSRESKIPVAPFLPYSRAQLAQDIFALAVSNSTSPKFFVEFGATDGITLSNTWLLEKHLGWQGILAEPARTWHEAAMPAMATSGHGFASMNPPLMTSKRFRLQIYWMPMMRLERFSSSPLTQKVVNLKF